MQSPWLLICAPLFLAAAVFWPQTPAEPVEPAPPPARERNWNEILSPARGRLPSPRPMVAWFDNLEQARTIAAREGRPMFVVMRCQPCKQCAEFDTEVLGGGPLLDTYLRQFVTVRLINVQKVDMRQFPMQAMQDLDLSWWGWFVSPEGSIYSVFGGKDEHGDASRISVAALAVTMKRVLEHHYDPRRGDWDVDVKPKRGEKPQTAFDLPGFPSWGRRFANDKPIECLHCHQVAEILRQPAIDAKTFDKNKDLQIWPYPENVGLELSRDDGLAVAAVRADSPAARIGIVPGDRIASAGNRKLFSQADLRSVLQRVPPAGGALELRWLRKGKLVQGTLQLEPEWKKVNLSWRQSIADGNIGANPGMAWANPLKADDRKRPGIVEGQMALRPYFGKDQKIWLARRAGVLPSDVILSINGQSPNIAGREFMAWFRLNFDPGETITVHVLDAKGAQRDVSFTATANGR